MKTKRFLFSLLFLLVFAASPVRSMAGEDSSTPNTKIPTHVKRALDGAESINNIVHAVEVRDCRDDDGKLFVTSDHLERNKKALEYLAKNQNAQGYWNENHPVAKAALAGLAFLASGSSPQSGPYAKNIIQIITFLLKNQQASGAISFNDGGQTMHSHGYATLFLAQCFGIGVDSSQNEGLRTSLTKASEFIAREQSNNGGWYYNPGSDKNADEGSITVTQIQALRAARDAGIRVDKKVIDKATQYIYKSQDDNGGVAYDIRSRNQGTLALTAAGLTVLHGAGDYGGDGKIKALNFIRSQINSSSSPWRGWGNYHYTMLYLTQAMHQEGGKDWSDFYPKMRTLLFETQKPDGSWDGDQGTVFGTAISSIVLSTPYKYLPIFTR